MFRDSGGFSSKMTPQDEQSLFRRTSDMFFYLRTHGVFSMTGFFRTFVPQCCNHGAEFFRPPQKCHKSASGKNSLYCKSGILSPATGASHSPVRQRGNRDYRTGWRGGGDARWARSPRGFIATAPDKVCQIAELALYNLMVKLGRVLLRKGRVNQIPCLRS